MKALAAENIVHGTGYPIPLYKNPLFQEKNFGINGYIEGRTVDYQSMNCPNTELLVTQTISFPQYVLLGEREDMEAIAEAIRRIKTYANEIKAAIGE
jgi:dTDP-4-amino-4,6-dideoxygalactose transaminase